MPSDGEDFRAFDEWGIKVFQTQQVKIRDESRHSVIASKTSHKIETIFFPLAILNDPTTHS